jgi:hypothetical protein
MKILGWCCLVWSLSLVGLPAQVTVEVQPQQEQFLPGEPLVVAVRVANASGQSLHLGADDSWLTFSVESKDGFLVSELQKLPVAGEFTLDSSKTAIKRVDLSSGFELGKPGRYTVTATVNVKEWNQEFPAKPKQFDIVQGAKLWEQEFGVPPRADQPSGLPEVRKYTLQQANYLKRLKLYVRVTDAAESRVIKVLPIGPMISFSRPEPQVDKESNLHVLWQTGARSFAYRVVNPDGVLTVRQTYDYTLTRPRLALSEAGNIVVQGGARREAADDFPAKEAAPALSAKP